METCNYTRHGDRCRLTDPETGEAIEWTRGDFRITHLRGFSPARQHDTADGAKAVTVNIYSKDNKAIKQ